MNFQQYFKIYQLVMLISKVLEILQNKLILEINYRFLLYYGNLCCLNYVHYLIS